MEIVKIDRVEDSTTGKVVEYKDFPDELKGLIDLVNHTRQRYADAKADMEGAALAIERLNKIISERVEEMFNPAEKEETSIDTTKSAIKTEK